MLARKLRKPIESARTGSYSYRDSGVDVDAAANLVRSIRPVVAKTGRPGADTTLGGFGAVFDLAKIRQRDPLLVAAADGVGTKLMVATEIGMHDRIGIDLVAMCVNDLVVQGAEPLFFLDYFATGRLTAEKTQAIIDSIAFGCQQAGCALIGGETAEMPGFYRNDEYDIAGFAVGVVERERLLPKRNDIAVGDVLLGLASNGVHANGFSLVRRLVRDRGLRYDDPPPFESQGRTLGEALLEPSRIYVDSVLAALKGDIKALAHITGGGMIDNVPRVLPDELAVRIQLEQWRAPPVFEWIAGDGDVDQREMLRTFNCGIGMVAVVEPSAADDATKDFEAAGETVYRLGKVEARPDGADLGVFTEGKLKLR